MTVVIMALANLANSWIYMRVFPLVQVYVH